MPDDATEPMPAPGNETKHVIDVQEMPQILHLLSLSYYDFFAYMTHPEEAHDMVDCDPN